MRVRTTVSAVLAACVVAAGASAVAAQAAPGHRHSRDPVVTGFQSESDPVRRIDASAGALGLVGVDGTNLDPSGAGVARPDAGALRQLAAAHRRHLPAQFLVGNFDDAINDFSEPLAHRMLADAGHRDTVARQLADDVRSQGWNGVNVDLESLAPRDAAGLVSFLRRLRADLPHGRTLALDLMADPSRGGYPALGYRVPQLARTVDRLVLMTYDEHGPWENTPGPVGSLAWTRRCLAALLAAGAPRNTIDLGVAGYGYAWRPHENIQLGDAAARRFVASHHARARWDARAAEWTATLADGSVIWWSDARSFRARYALARHDRLHGVAVWSLGLSDPLRLPSSR